MKRVLSISIAAAFLLVFGLGMVHAQQAGNTYSGQGQGGRGHAYNTASGGWHCPWMGHGSMMQDRGGMGCGMMEAEGERQNTDRLLTKDQAEQMMENYVRYLNNPNLGAGDVIDKGDLFESAIVTKDGLLMEKVQIDKSTRSYRNVYR